MRLFRIGAAGYIRSAWISSLTTTILAAMLPLSPAGAGVVKFMAPGSNETTVAGINSAGDVTGTANANSGAEYGFGFIRSAGGNFATFSDAHGGNLWATAIDDNDDVTGYENYDGGVEAFVRSPSGTVTTFLAFGSLGTIPAAINATSGKIVGQYTDSNSITHGFVRVADGTISSIDPPNAVYSEADGTNSSGEIVGWFVDSSGGAHGFLQSADGTITTIDAPWSQGSTQAFVINNNGDVAGEAFNTTFIRYANGNYAEPGQNIQPSGLSDEDDISGGTTGGDAALFSPTKRSWKLKLIKPPHNCLFVSGGSEGNMQFYINDSATLGATVQCSPGEANRGYIRN